MALGLRELDTSIPAGRLVSSGLHIRDYSRLLLIIEVLQRFCRILSDPPPSGGLDEHMKAGCEQSSGQQLYSLSAQEALAAADIDLIQTGIKVHKAAVRIDIRIAEAGEVGYRVSYPQQSVGGRAHPNGGRPNLTKASARGARWPSSVQRPTEKPTGG